jgi:hypothetical protein
VSHDVLPKQFDLLVKRFHYLEPVGSSVPMARMVLRRYDADIYRSSTLLADAIRRGDRVTKGRLFEDSQPYVSDQDRIRTSDENRHLFELTARATELAERGLRDVEGGLTPVLRAALATVRGRLVELSTSIFLRCLDVISLPREFAGRRLHAAGDTHSDGAVEGDFLCLCWNHRECIDRLSDFDADAAPLAEFLQIAAAIQASGITTNPTYDQAERANLRANIVAAGAPA